MNVRKNLIVFLPTCLFGFLQPLSLFSDQCDDVMAEAIQVGDDAKALYAQKDFTQAAELYRRAAGSYLAASEMKECSNSEIPAVALQNIQVCNNNAAKAEKNAAEVENLAIYKSAQAKVMQGNEYANNNQWELAISVFEEAANIFDSVSDSKTGTGKAAIKSAESARNLANNIRQHMESL